MAVGLIEYWKEISIFIGGAVSFIVGRKSTKILEKKQTVDAIDAMQKTYDIFLGHYKEQYTTLSEKLNKLQEQFEGLQYSYKIEAEAAKNWETLHRELDKKYTELEKLYEKLKSDFEKYKKTNNK